MASTIEIINTIDVNFPVAGQDNDSEGFRTNFNKIQSALTRVQSTITQLQNSISILGGADTIQANHLIANIDLKVGNSFFSIDPEDNLVITSYGDVFIRPSTGVQIITQGAYALTDSITNSSTGTFAVDDVANIEIGATIIFPNVPNTVFTVTALNEDNNLVTVTPEIPDSPAPFAVGDFLTFSNPFDGNTATQNLYVFGDIFATGNITAFAGSPSDARLKENIVTITNALSIIDGMRGVYYDWTDEYLENFTGNVFVPKHDTGVIAQEIQEVLPEVVFMKPNGDLSVRYEKIVGVLIQAVKELKEEVNSLKSQINGQ